MNSGPAGGGGGAGKGEDVVCSQARPRAKPAAAFWEIEPQSPGVHPVAWLGEGEGEGGP